MSKSKSLVYLSLLRSLVVSLRSLVVSDTALRKPANLVRSTSDD